jgi:hypothetical protein
MLMQMKDGNVQYIKMKELLKREDDRDRQALSKYYQEEQRRENALQ